jgi:hypothetical protein
MHATTQHAVPTYHPAGIIRPYNVTTNSSCTDPAVCTTPVTVGDEAAATAAAAAVTVGDEAAAAAAAAVTVGDEAAAAAAAVTVGDEAAAGVHCSAEQLLPCFLRFSDWMVPRGDASNMRCKVGVLKV